MKPTTQQLAALAAFRDTHSNTWEARLSHLWMRGDARNPELYQLRGVCAGSTAKARKLLSQADDRRIRINTVLSLFDDNDNGTRMTDLLVDIMHYAEHYGYDFDHLVEMAAVHHRAEAKS